MRECAKERAWRVAWRVRARCGSMNAMRCLGSLRPSRVECGAKKSDLKSQPRKTDRRKSTKQENQQLSDRRNKRNRCATATHMYRAIYGLIALF